MKAKITFALTWLLALANFAGYSQTTNTNGIVVTRKISSYPLATSASPSDNFLVEKLSGTNWNVYNMPFSMVQTTVQALISSNLLGEFNVKDFGALGTGLTASGVAIASGSASLTATNGHFNSSDVGKVISVYGAGPGNLNLTATIASVVNSTNVILSAVASKTVTVNQAYGASLVYGYDDTTAIQAGINYVCTNGGGTLYFPKGVYIVNGPILDPGDPTNHHSSQLYLPNITPTGIVAPTIKFLGQSTPSYSQGIFNHSVPAGQNGSIIWSTLPVLTNSMLSCQNYVNPVYVLSLSNPNDYEDIVSFNFVRVELQSMMFRGTFDSQGCLLDMRGACNMSMRDCIADTAYMAYMTPQMTNANGYGIRFPGSCNAGPIDVDNLVVNGFYNDVAFGEHFTAGHMHLSSAQNAISTRGAGSHLNTVKNLDIWDCATYIYAAQDSSAEIIANITGENLVVDWTANPHLVVGTNAPGYNAAIVYGEITCDVNPTPPSLGSGGVYLCVKTMSLAFGAAADRITLQWDSRIGGYTPIVYNDLNPYGTFDHFWEQAGNVLWRTGYGYGSTFPGVTQNYGMHWMPTGGPLGFACGAFEIELDGRVYAYSNITSLASVIAVGGIFTNANAVTGNFTNVNAVTGNFTNATAKTLSIGPIGAQNTIITNIVGWRTAGTIIGSWVVQPTNSTIVSWTLQGSFPASIAWASNSKIIPCVAASQALFNQSLSITSAYLNAGVLYMVVANTTTTAKTTPTTWDLSLFTLDF